MEVAQLRRNDFSPAALRANGGSPVVRDPRPTFSELLYVEGEASLEFDNPASRRAGLSGKVQASRGLLASVPRG